MSENIYEKLSQERKALQVSGDLPQWVSTASWQTLKDKYIYKATGLKDTFKRMSHTFAKHMGDDAPEWEEKFFTMMWNGWLSNASPLFNAGTDRGLTVSCSGQYMPDNMYGIADADTEMSVLTQRGFGTSQYLGHIRCRGSRITGGGIAEGIIPIVESIVARMKYVSQGSARRGACGIYLPVDHGDFEELYEMLLNTPDSLNVGWIFSQEFIDRLESGDLEALDRYQKVLEVRVKRGKGYICKITTINNQNPQMYKDLDLNVLGSNLCMEICLMSDSEHSFTCVLSSLNLAKYNEWKDTETIFNSIVYLDCVVEEFLQQANEMLGLEKAVRFTRKSRALGLGVLGYHSYLQQEMLPFESFEAMQFNNIFFKHMKKEAVRASQWIAQRNGEPEWCKGYGVAHTHLIAIAPTFTSSTIMGGVSLGIEPFVANVFNQPSASGELFRVNPTFLAIAKREGKWVEGIKEKVIQDINENFGSVQQFDWLTQLEKDVLKTAYEINQEVIIRKASQRQRYICQGQSVNVFFSADAPEEYISYIHTIGLLDPFFKGFYYYRGSAGVIGSNGECRACHA